MSHPLSNSGVAYRVVSGLTSRPHHCLATSLTSSSFSSAHRAINGNPILSTPAATASACVPHWHHRPLIRTTSTASLYILNLQRRQFFTDNTNPYAILGIKQGASKVEIKKAYRTMAAKHHPDAPGGTNEKFQELQAAYDEIKTGVWIPKGGGSGGSGEARGSGGSRSKYDGFQWYTDGKRGSKKSYEKMQQEMHGAETRKSDFEDDEDVDREEKKSKKYNNPMGASDVMVQAWFRLISLWAGVFVVLRVGLFFTFPPKHQPLQRKPLPKHPRKPPPPKPVQHSPMSA